MGEFLYHPYPMSHVDLRELAFQMRSEELRKYGQDVLRRDPSRIAPAEVLDLMAYLVACDFVGAEAKCNTIKFKFKGTKDEVYLNEATSLARAHIDFALGRFKDMDEAANSFLTNHRTIPNLEEGEFLDVLRLLAQKQMILDEYEDLRRTYQEMVNYKSTVNSTNLHYLIDSVQAMLLLADGEYFKAMEMAKLNIEIANQNGYTGLMAPLDSMYVLAGTLFATSRSQESQALYVQLKETSKKLNLWPWYFIADGFIAREYAYRRDMSGALALVREERNLLSEFSFRHELNFIPDVNELYVRFLISDWERVEVLVNRVPQLIFVQQIASFLWELKGDDMLKYIESLPDKTARQKVYKSLALAGYYKDKESVSIDYMREALEVVEQSGSIELILRQHDLFSIVLKAIAKKPTAFLENIGTRLTERIKLINQHKTDGMPVPLTNRELEIVKHLSTGKPIRAIGEILHISMNTMKTHLRNIYRKLEVEGRDSAVEKAKELFLI